MKAAKLMVLCVIVLMVATQAFGSDYATELISYSSTLTGSTLYNDPTAVLGAPSTVFANTWGSNPTARVKLVEPAYNKDTSVINSSRRSMPVRRSWSNSTTKWKTTPTTLMG